MLKFLNRKLRRLCSRLRWPRRRRIRPRVLVIKKFGKTTSYETNSHPEKTIDSFVNASSPSAVHPNSQFYLLNTQRPIRIATFNAASFSMAPAVPEKSNSSAKFRRSLDSNSRTKSVNDRPKSILKQSPLHTNSINSGVAKTKPRVSINLPDNEISLLRNRQASEYEMEENLSSSGNDRRGMGIAKSGTPLRWTVSMPSERGSYRCSRTVVEVLRDLDADILALQDVKAEEEKQMRPLSDLAEALGMKYVFAESWAPEYGNAVLSRWPIKRWKVEKIFDDTDFRNVLKATIDVEEVGEVNVQCTHLDHLDENWRMKQIKSIIRSNNNEPHILLGGLNSLDPTDYSQQRWTDIVKYYEEIGKPTPEAKVTKFLKSNMQYRDAKEYGGECESVVMIAKGQSVQGTCKYGTRVDYILASPDANYEFVQGSYSVISSKGTSDHHIVKVDFLKLPHRPPQPRPQPQTQLHSHSLSPWKKRWT
ncbi:hypothetical protein IC582_010052 [Cucumis melo]|uniref:Uncharacterized protein LOC103491341 n=2 Tax=Cucumis melo TaxID=3656 RepID=A0A1S3BLG5_CUCME|nr:uncharacterized protein LOC103491341 [Cucumis melo]KAA0057289.1 DNAse I-like superfamily protein [Cucumis melo var. makuwa]TYK13443.1 DNAse I-like superfamily protein [Cucumis melo var. makuwa]